MRIDYIPEHTYYWRRPRRRLRVLGLILFVPAAVSAFVLKAQSPGSEHTATPRHAARQGTIALPIVNDTVRTRSVSDTPISRPPRRSVQPHSLANRPGEPVTLTVATALQPSSGASPADTDTAIASVSSNLASDRSDEGLAAEADSDFQASNAPLLPQTGLADKDAWTDITVKRGDTLSEIFDRSGLPPSDWVAVTKLKGAHAALRTLHPGDELQLRKGDDGHLAELLFSYDASHTLHVTRRRGRYTALIQTDPLQHRTAVASGTIHNSLYLAGDAAGLSDRLIMQMSHVFGWKVDFSRDIRAGDHFTVIYDQIWQNGKKLRNGNILAAEFVNRGTLYRAYRFVTPSGDAGYYTAAGKSLRKALLRAPLHYKYISSPFNRHRMHPILHIVRPHLGVDYAAPTGTPVEAAGDGRIDFAGRKGGYGNVVLIRHNASYETVYGHLHNFAAGLHRGERVKQGQIIGYVGATGLATGPHLHFGIRVDGHFENPRNVALPRGAPVSRRYMARFERTVHPLATQLAALDKKGGVRLASQN